MVKRDGNSLTWVQDQFDKLGYDKVAVNPGDTGYDEALTTEDMQNNSRRQNKTNIDHWMTEMQQYKTNVDAGRGDTVTLPDKPELTVVSDPIKLLDGEVIPGELRTIVWPQ